MSPRGERADFGFRVLAGLVPAEMYASAPLEALKAQAVTARAELFSKVGKRHLSDPYLVCGHQHCQVYKGAGVNRKSTDKAVAQTRGQMLFKGQRLADARYHSTCGGHTEDGDYVWTGNESDELKGTTDLVKPGDLDLGKEDEARVFIDNKPDSYCARSGKTARTLRWTVELSQKELDGRLNKKYDLGTVKSIVPLSRGVSGRIGKLKVIGSRRAVTINGELVIRRAFGGLKSSQFYVIAPNRANGNKWQIRGGGFGHGAGMCQNGAAGMALGGFDFKAILKHYFKGVSVKQIY